MQEYLEHKDINTNYQSAYTRRQQTETALLTVHNDIAEVLDGGSTTGLILLDISATVYAIDHPFLLKRLEFSFGIKKNTLT